MLKISSPLIMASVKNQQQVSKRLKMPLVLPILSLSRGQEVLADLHLLLRESLEPRLKPVFPNSDSLLGPFSIKRRHLSLTNSIWNNSK
jgi:hypothetical protein